MNKPKQTNTNTTTVESSSVANASGTDVSGDLQYELDSGYIHAWLVAGAVKTPVHDLDRYRGEDFKAQIAQAYFRPGQINALAPAEGRKFDQLDPLGESQTLTWQSVRCGDDHYVNLSSFYHTCHYLTAWAYAKVAAPLAQEITFTLTTNGPADVWINGAHVHRQEHFALQRPQSQRFAATLAAGENQVLVRFEVVAARACPFLMALHLDLPQDAQDTQTASGYQVLLPTTRTPLARRAKLEQIFDLAYVTQSVYHRQDELRVHWPDTMTLSDNLTVRLQSRTGRIYGEAQPEIKRGATVNFGAVYQVPDGDYYVVLLPSINEYYLHKMQIDRRIPIRIANGKHTADGKHGESAQGSYRERQHEVLVHAARSGLGLYAQIARMTLGDWQRVSEEVVRTSIERINQRADCSDFDMVGLLGLLIRHGSDPNFPEALRQPLTACVLGFKYWMDEPGDDAMCYWTENHQILFHTCQVLAGQLFPDGRFTNTDQSGRWHQALGEQRALSWLRKRATGGFQEWDSNCYFNEDVLALAHLADLAVDDTVAELAAVILDKLSFTVALNSFKGVFGSTHGRSYTSLILGGRGEPTSGISRLLWGQGSLNNGFKGAVALACAQTYELPPLIADIATDTTQPLWNREHHAGQREKWCDLDDNKWEINKATYKTADYMLASAQDYRPGQQGFQQHIWQATLGPDAVVFANHPVCVHDENDLRPNFWSGNGVLPRAAQWKETLIAIYRLPADDWMGWTHAYFPTAAFDEVTMQGGWIFGRKGDGYIALTAANGLELQQQGAWAQREIRSPGRHNVWLCQMGRAADDGDFAAFVQAILARPPHFGDLAVTLQNLRGEELAFAWEGPLTVDGRAEPITDFRHYDNHYCQAELPSEEMVIQFRDQQMRLDFSLEAQEA